MRGQAGSLPCVCGTLRDIIRITSNLDKEGRMQESFHKEARFKISLEAQGRVCMAPGNKIRYCKSEIVRAVTSGERKSGFKFWVVTIQVSEDVHPAWGEADTASLPWPCRDPSPGEQSRGLLPPPLPDLQSPGWAERSAAGLTIPQRKRESRQRQMRRDVVLAQPPRRPRHPSRP